MQRPTWLPKTLPELDGLRGLAVLGVVFYHCDPLLADTWIHPATQWGWAGVNLFFVLSGFLITSILLDARGKPRYFRNFYVRRILRIWPVYALVVAVCYWQSGWFIDPKVPDQIRSPFWPGYIFFTQNLFRVTLPASLVPTWSLAIEQQYYLFWAPLVRFLRRPWMLATFLFAALAGTALLRQAHLAWITPLNTLINLDGIAIGSLLALGLYTLALSRRTWLLLGLVSFALGMGAAFTVAGGTVYLNTALATGFAGAVLAAMASTGARNPVNVLLRRGPLAFYGRISYGLYMIHIMSFIFIGWFDLWMVRYGMAGNLAVVAARFAVSTALAAAMWYGFESQILKLKRYF
ncbi:MAG: acyltransferase [Terracidiphilus sp.]|jgi:peptidoglycan/LPS O-acetylase OafA/YrhL